MASKKGSRNREKITATLTDTQYYCEYCEQVFEYRDLDQHGCEICNHVIQDNNIVEISR